MTKHDSVAGRRVTSVDGKYRVWSPDGDLIAEAGTYAEAAFAARADAIAHSWRGQLKLEERS